MVKRYTKHIVLLLACWAGLAASALCQKADSAVNASDTVIQQAGAGSSGSNSTSDDTSATAMLDKFERKDKRPAPAERKIPKAKMNETTSSNDFWYANKLVPGEKPVVKNGSLATVLQLVFWVLAGVIVIAIIVASIMFFTNKPKVISGDGQGAPGEGDPENIFEMDFDSRIQAAVSAGDYRLATRLLFLRLLRSLAEKNIINYSIDKTNFDYQFELSSTKYFKDFSAVSRNYEYVWYGNFNIQQGQFILLQQRLDELNQQINN